MRAMYYNLRNTSKFYLYPGQVVCLHCCYNPEQPNDVWPYIQVGCSQTACTNTSKDDCDKLSYLAFLLKARCHPCKYIVKNNTQSLFYNGNTLQFRREKVGCLQIIEFLTQTQVLGLLLPPLFPLTKQLRGFGLSVLLL